MRDSAPMAAAREVRMLADVMTLVTLGDSDVRMVALVDVTVVQGEPRTHRRPPAGRLRVDGRVRQLARDERVSGDGGVDADGRRPGRAPSPVSAQPRAPARRRVVHARHRVPDAARRAARARRSGGRRASARSSSRRRSAPGMQRIDVRELERRAAIAGAAADALGVPLSAEPATRRRRLRWTSSASPMPACSRPSPIAPSRRRS